MKTKTYDNVNFNLNFENICLILEKFWINEVLTGNNSKIWLSITVYNKRKKVYTIFKNLPFNTNSYTDVVIVLKQIFNSSVLPNKKTVFTCMTFSFYLENKYGWKEYSLDIIIFILYIISLICGIFILFYIINEIIYLINVVDKNILEVVADITISENITKESVYVKQTNKCIFNVFIDLFNSSSSFKHCPDYFIDSKIKLINEKNNIPLTDYIISKQFYILNNTVQSFSEYFNKNELLKYDLNSIVKEYSYYKQYCITKY